MRPIKLLKSEYLLQAHADGSLDLVYPPRHANDK